MKNALIQIACDVLEEALTENGIEFKVEPFISMNDIDTYKFTIEYTQSSFEIIYEVDRFIIETSCNRYIVFYNLYEVIRYLEMMKRVDTIMSKGEVVDSYKKVKNDR